MVKRAAIIAKSETMPGDANRQHRRHGSHRTARTAAKAHPDADALPNGKTTARMVDHSSILSRQIPSTGNAAINRAQRICTAEMVLHVTLRRLARKW
jgi:hypothetical protein